MSKQSDADKARKEFRAAQEKWNSAATAADRAYHAEVDDWHENDKMHKDPLGQQKAAAAKQKYEALETEKEAIVVLKGPNDKTVLDVVNEENREFTTWQKYNPIAQELRQAALDKAKMAANKVRDDAKILYDKAKQALQKFGKNVAIAGVVASAATSHGATHNHAKAKVSSHLPHVASPMKAQEDCGVAPIVGNDGTVVVEKKAVAEFQKAVSGSDQLPEYLRDKDNTADSKWNYLTRAFAVANGIPLDSEARRKIDQLKSDPDKQQAAWDKTFELMNSQVDTRAMMNEITPVLKGSSATAIQPGKKADLIAQSTDAPHGNRAAHPKIFAEQFSPADPSGLTQAKDLGIGSGDLVANLFKDKQSANPLGLGTA